ncbi:MAG: Hsp20/alpha crystallin family protein [Brevundimonas sp.]|uniref:Hsp20/alpha crystallin family protein n=1 Tax=Brevundimonas sp. TaxID=1871086 RepID=UPI0025BA2742|nr:Hsp20/alpha crystallin family protein [Brevundimonas sp.]MCH4267292.1 Hsp20/alpha crystallin family protein [Brevundimonas sp.]
MNQNPPARLSGRGRSILKSREKRQAESKPCSTTPVVAGPVRSPPLRLGETRARPGRCYTERAYGRFERRLALDHEVEDDKVQASFMNGVLDIKIPKSRTRRIEAKAG